MRFLKFGTLLLLALPLLADDAAKIDSATLGGLRARFPVLAQQVNRIDVTEGESFWLEHHRKRVEATARGVELTKEEERKAVIEEVIEVTSRLIFDGLKSRYGLPDLQTRG